MKATSFESIVENGKIQVPAEIRLPDGTRVYVTIQDGDRLSSAFVGSPRLVNREQLSDFEKEVIEDPHDAGV